jgi:hypothetical protein
MLVVEAEMAEVLPLAHREEQLQFQQQAAVVAAVLMRHHGLLAEMVNGFSVTIHLHLGDKR